MNKSLESMTKAELIQQLTQIKSNNAIKVDKEKSAVYFNDTIKVVTSVANVTTQKGVKKQKLLTTVNISDIVKAIDNRATHGCTDIPNQITIESVPYSSSNTPLAQNSISFAGEARVSIKHYENAK